MASTLRNANLKHLKQNIFNLRKIKTSFPRFAMMVRNIGVAKKSWSRRSSAIKDLLSPGESNSGAQDVKNPTAPFLRSVSESLMRRKTGEKSPEDDVDQGIKLNAENVSDQKYTSSKIFDEIRSDSISTNDDENNYTVDSNKFLYGVFCACLLVQIWNNLWLLHLIPLPVAYFAMKKVAGRFGVGSFIKANFVKPFQEFYAEEDGLSRKFS